MEFIFFFLFSKLNCTHEGLRQIKMKYDVHFCMRIKRRLDSTSIFALEICTRIEKDFQKVLLIVPKRVKTRNFIL
jgi:hypothetical protein